jgi:hypothetical protein
VADAILGKQGRVENPDKDEVTLLTRRLRRLVHEPALARFGPYLSRTRIPSPPRFEGEDRRPWLSSRLSSNVMGPGATTPA